jgi:ankyrin repeat protein
MKGAVLRTGVSVAMLCAFGSFQIALGQTIGGIWQNAVQTQALIDNITFTMGTGAPYVGNHDAIPLNPLLLQAAKSGNVAQIRSLIALAADINFQDSFGRTPLMVAILSGNKDVAMMLVEYPYTNATLRDRQGKTALMFAAAQGMRAIVRSLIIDHGVMINAQDYDAGWTPLFYAAAAGRAQMLQLLLDLGGDPNVEDKEGQTVESFVLSIQSSAESDPNEHGYIPHVGQDVLSDSYMTRLDSILVILRSYDKVSPMSKSTDHFFHLW